jgi:YVTN family beta-propeller protein
MKAYQLIRMSGFVLSIVALFVNALGANPGAFLRPPVARAMEAAPKVYVGLFKDNAVGVIDSGTNTEVTTIPVPEGPHGLVLTPDGKKVYVSSDGASTVSVIDTTSDRVVSSIEVGQTPHGLSISRDGRWVVVSGFGSNQEEVIDTSTDQVVMRFPVASPHNSAISPDGSLIYVGSQATPSALVLLSIPEQRQILTVPLDAQPRALDFDPDGDHLFFTLVGSDAVQVLDVRSSQLQSEIPVGAAPHQPLFTSDGYAALVVAQGPGELDIVDAEDHDVESRVNVGTFPHWVALSSDGGTAYVTNEGSNDVSVVNLRTNTVTATIAVGNAPRKIAVQPGPSGPAATRPAFTTSASGSRQLLSATQVTDVDLDSQNISGQTDADLVADDYFFAPSALRGTPGQILRLRIQNQSGTLHNFSIEGQVDQDLPARGEGDVNVVFPDTGTLAFFCKYHTRLGMNGQLLVEDAAVQG